MNRIALGVCLAALLPGCASKNPERAESPPGSAPTVFGAPSEQQTDLSTQRESDVAPVVTPDSDAARAASPPSAIAVPPPLEPPSAASAPAKIQELGEMSDKTPGAAEVRRGPCNLDNCAIVIGIAAHDVTQSIAEDDGSAGLYLPQGMYGGETADQPGIWDAYGVQKIIRVWDVSVLLHDGVVRVIPQPMQPLFRVGDPVLVNGDKLLLWN